MKRFHFTIALAATLTGCTCFAPQYAARTDSKTIAKSGKVVAVKKKSARHRTSADTRTKIAASPTAVKTPPQRDDKSNAESKNSIATEIQTTQPSQSDGKSNAESSMNAIAACCVSGHEPGRQERCLWKFYRHNLRPRERQIGRRHRRQAISIRRSKRRGLYWRVRFSYGRISQYL